MTTTSVKPVDYSIVIPVYFNEGALTATLESIRREVIACNPELHGEVIFVDDGSGDGSFDELMQLRDQDPETIRVVKLSRNFGQVNAIMAGLSLARGKCAVTLSADGQDPAALINRMLRSYFDEGVEIVMCTRQGRDESWYRVLTSRVFYALMRRLSFPDMPSGGFDFVLLGQRALAVLLSNPEAHPFFQGQILWMGFRTKSIGYRRLERRVGKSRWTFGKKLTYLIDGTVSYSFLPIRLASGVGILVALLGFLYAAIVFISKIVWGNPVQGWAPLMMVLLVMGGFQMLMLGLIGEYLWRTLNEARRRPRYVIEAVFGPDGQQPWG